MVEPLFEQAVLDQPGQPLGENTSGTFQIAFDGSDVGLVSGYGDVDSLHVEPDGTFLISITGNRTFSGIGYVDDSDVLAFSPTSLGDNTVGTWSLYFDGSANGLEIWQEDVNALRLVDEALYISTLVGGDVGFIFNKGDVLACEALAGPTGPCSWSTWLNGYILGLNGYGIDGLSAAAEN